MNMTMIKKIAEIIERNWDDATSEEIAKAVIRALHDIDQEYVSGIMQASLDCTPINRCEEQALQVWQNTCHAILANDPNFGM